MMIGKSLQMFDISEVEIVKNVLFSIILRLTLGSSKYILSIELLSGDFSVLCRQINKVIILRVIRFRANIQLSLSDPITKLAYCRGDRKSRPDNRHIWFMGHFGLLNICPIR